MTVNKKRMCCCGTSENPYYLELFPVVTIQTGEKTLSGTYSFWLNLEDTTLSGSTLMFDYVTGATNTNATADIPYTSTTGIAMVFPPDGNSDIGTKCLKSGITSMADHSLLRRADALVRRGMEPKTTSRVLRLSAVLALSENRILFNKIESKTTSGVPGTYWYEKRGYVFVSDQYNATPAVSTTITRGDGETFDWEIYPKVSANLPEKILARDPEDNTHEEWFDFTYSFPSTITVRNKATYDIQVSPDQGVYEFVSVDLDASATYTKTVTGYSDASPGGLGPDTGAMTYTKTSQDTYFNGSGTSHSYTDRNGDPATANIRIFYNPRPTIFQHLNYTGGFGQLTRDQDYRGAVRLNKDISTNLNANLLACTSCDPFSTPRLSAFCTSHNYDGTETKNRMVNNSISSFFASVTQFDNTTGGQVTWQAGASFAPNDIAGIQMVGMGPAIEWGEVTTSVSFALQDMQFGTDLPAFYPEGPDVGCLFAGAGTGDFVFDFVGLPPGGGTVESSIPNELNSDFNSITIFSIT